MARTKRGVVSRAKHKKVLKSVKGQRGRRKNTIRIARQAMEKAMQYAYRDRKAKKREVRSSLILFKFEAKSFLFSGSKDPKVLNWIVIWPFFPKNSVLIFWRSSFVLTESIFALNTELILSKSLIR